MKPIEKQTPSAPPRTSASGTPDTRTFETSLARLRERVARRAGRGWVRFT
jgi:hypothetical protein